MHQKPQDTPLPAAKGDIYTFTEGPPGFSFPLQPTLPGRRGQGREAEVAATAPQALCAPPPWSQASGDHYQSQVTPGLSLITLQAPDIVHSLQASSLLRGNLAFRTPLQVCQGCWDTEGVVEDITNSP